jgi:flagellin-specific chaperone FliS
LAAARSPEQLQQLYQQLQQQIADSEFESAAETLPKILTFLEQLPDGWTDYNDWVSVVAEVDDYLNALQPELEQTRDEISAAVTKIGKSKKGVKAYTKV